MSHVASASSRSRSGARPPADEAPLEEPVAGRTRRLAGALAAELTGSFLFIWLGTGTVLAVHALQPGAPANSVSADVAISVAFGFALAVAVYATGPISGAHLNPAVTLALAAVRAFPARVVPLYWAAQIVGATLAGLANWYLFGDDDRSGLLLGATQPGSGGWGPALLAEFLITMLLMLTIATLAVDEKRSPGPVAAGLGIGLVVAAGIFATLPVSGGSFNPARTLGPMIAAGSFHDWWVYVAGPVAGALFAMGLHQLVLQHGQTPGQGRVP
jgi:MIP family channel proteins